MLATVAAALAVVTIGVLLGLRLRPQGAPHPAAAPTPPAVTTPSPSAPVSPTPVPSGSLSPAAGPATPPSRNAAAGAYDPVGHRFIVFGGINGSGGTALADTWAWDDRGWSQLGPATSPPPTWYANAVTLGGQRTVILVGGLHEPSYSGPAVPTWQWDGTTWRLLHPLHSPPSGIAAGLAYDPGHRQAVLLTQEQTWIWDGSDWTQQHPATSPPARELAAMATGAGGNGVVLFGGNVPGDTSRNFGDTWAWDGSAWTLRSASAPPSRSGAVMVYDPAAGQPLLFGGRDDASRTAYTDTWTWDGARWSRLAQDGPSPWGLEAATYDDAAGQVVMVGDFGTELPNRTTATWTWNGSMWIRRR